MAVQNKESTNNEILSLAYIFLDKVINSFISRRKTSWMDEKNSTIADKGRTPTWSIFFTSRAFVA